MLCSSCVSRGVREAQEVVAQADSLWHDGQMYGVDAGDSATLAQAYETLDKSTAFCRRIRDIFPFVLRTSSLGTYSHACYHYGRLLREKDDPIAAMEVFINATHSHTDDYHILGRVYSNMGDIAHRAEDFSLSYDMFERSANMYWQNGDTLLYYYSLNNMAYEKAEQADSVMVSNILQTIDTVQNADLSFLIALTRAELYMRCKQYGLSLNYGRKAFAYSQDYSAAPALVMAQSCSHLGQKDSAVYYANIVLSKTNEVDETNNALYILTNDDETKDKAAILESAADRSDTQKIIEVQRGKFSQATQILKLHLQRKPDLRWLVAILGTVFFIGCIVGLYIYRKRKQKALLAQEIAHLETKYNDIQSGKANQLKQICTTLRASENLQKDLCWKDFDKMCHFVNEHMFLLAGKLRSKQILNETEIRLCVLVLVGLNRTEIANTLPYALNSVGKLKDHTAKLLGTTGKNLRNFLLKMAIE